MERALAEVDAHRAAVVGDYRRAVELAAKAPSIDSMRVALWMLEAGQVDESLEKARRTVQQHDQEVQPLAWFIYLLAKAERWQEVSAEFEKLRTWAADADLAFAPMVRLEPIARKLGYPADWRLARPAKNDLGPRPPLETLGPFRWQPPLSESWTLPDDTGQPRSLKDFSGRTVVVIFYLGAGCLHCMQQLQAFAAEASKFREHQIDLVAISTDSQEELHRAVKNYQNGSFSIPLLSDHSLEVFKKYRCYDDFERQPLHGTFLIDPQRRCIWHDISYEPFMDVKFVLDEALRQRRIKCYEQDTAAASQATNAADRASSADCGMLPNAQQR